MLPKNAVTQGNLLQISNGYQIIPSLYDYSLTFPSFFRCLKKTNLEGDLKGTSEMPKMSRFLFSFSTRWLLTLGYARGLCCFLDYLTFVLAAGFSCSHSASIFTIISSAGCHWIFPIICLMSSCQFAAKPSLAKQPQEAAELAKFDSRAMLTDSSGINHKLHSSLFIKRMSSLDHAHVGRPVKLDWQTVASLVDGKIPVLTIWHWWKWDAVMVKRLLEHAMLQSQQIPVQSSLTTTNTLHTCLLSLDLV